jgi:hypothetical protein
MKTMRLGVVLVSLLFLQVFLGLGLSYNAQAMGVPDVYVGLDMAYGDSVAEAKRLIDEVSPYTNLFVIGCKGITYNTARLNETCQYIVDKGLNFIVYRDTSLGRNATWAELAKKTWGDRFLGYYAFDELGGWQIDMHEWRMVVDAPANYSDAANSFVSMAEYYLDRFARFRNSTQFNLYTSDYALYWFDYEAGYDTVFAEFGWNYSRQLNIALCRGAANMRGKDWGAIITWTYTQPPYLESGKELYADLVLAYQNGAKYILLFDSNEGWTQSVLKQEHLDALKRFWGYVKENPRQNTQVNDRVAYVLPKDYGYGFRGPDDKIWGFWEADSLAGKVCGDLSNLFTQYGERLDIIYDVGLLPGNTYGYSKLFYWNDPSLSQAQSPSIAPSTSPSSTPTQTPTPAPIENPQSFMDYVPLIGAGAVIAVVAVPAYLLRKRQYCITFAQTGVGADFTDTVVVVDGESYDKYGASFLWDSGSRHTYEFKSPIVVSRGKQYVKHYVLASTTGMTTDQNGILTVSTSSTVTGNYKPVFKIGASLPTVMNHRLRSAKNA